MRGSSQPGLDKRGIVTDNIGVKPLAQKAAGDILHSFDFVFGRLCGGKDDWQLLALVGAVHVVHSGVRWVHASKAR